MNKSLSATVKKGRNGDDHLAHLQTGEMVVPAPVLSDELKAQLYQEMIDAGIDPSEYTVGEGMSINPETGLPEFGFGKFFKKAFKSIKKVVRSPLGSIGLSLLAPGLGSALGAGLGISGLAGSGLVGGGIGALSGNGLKGILGGALSGSAAGGLGNYVGKGLGLSGLGANTIGSSLVGTAGGLISGGGAKNAILQGGLSGLGGFYQGGGFNNVGKAFKDSGLSGVLTQLGDNVSGKGDVLSATGAPTAGVAGGGASSYSPQTTLKDGGNITWDQNVNPSTALSGGNSINWDSTTTTPSIGDNLLSGRGLNSLLSAGIGTYSNDKAANELLKYQKQGLSALQPYLNHQFNPGDLENDPGYQFQLKQGTKALNSASAARGNYFSGDALRSAGEYATGLADMTYNDAFNRDRSQNNDNIQGILSKYGILGDIGNTKATKTINNANTWTDSIANLLQPQDPYEMLLKKYLGT